MLSTRLGEDAPSSHYCLKSLLQEVATWSSGFRVRFHLSQAVVKGGETKLPAFLCHLSLI